MRISDWSSDVCSSDLARPTPSSSPDRRRSPTMPSVGEIRIVAGERLGIFAGLLSKLLLRELFVACLFEIIVIAAGLRARSEEHTSELQSLMRISYAVFFLNKKTRHNNRYRD